MGEITIRCMYSCHVCGLEKVPVFVPARNDGEDVKHWLEQVAAVAMSEDHQKRSPACRPETLSEVLIPLDGATMIGGPAIQ